MAIKKKPKLRNQLWYARKRLGLHQKHVAYLLRQKSTYQISRFEQGHLIPGLKVLLQLEIIYGVPIRMLYRDYYEELRKAIEQRAQTLSAVRNAYLHAPPDSGHFTAYCSHEDLLNAPSVSQADRDHIRDHVVLLMRRLNKLL